MDKRDEPPEWLRQAAQNIDAIITSSWPVIRAAQEYIEQVRAAHGKAAAEIAVALDSSMAEVIATFRRSDAPRHHTATANLTIPLKFVAMADVVGVTDTLSVVKQDASGRTLVPVSVIVALAPWLLLLICWALTLGETRLSPDQHQFLSDFTANLALALTAWQVRDTFKR